MNQAAKTAALDSIFLKFRPGYFWSTQKLQSVL